MTARFDTRRVDGSMSLVGPNSFSAAPIFSGPISAMGSAASFNTPLTAPNMSGQIFGSFAGPTAQEVGGTFYLDNASTREGAVGIFHAKQ